MTEPPRRLDPTPAQRVEMAIERSAGGVAGSGTRYSRPIPNGGNRSYAHGIPAGGDAGQGLVKLSDDDYDVDWGASGGGVSAQAFYEDTRTGWSGGSFEPAGLVSGTGDGTLFEYVSSSPWGPGIKFLTAGYYQAAVDVYVNGQNVGDTLILQTEGNEGTPFGFPLATSMFTALGPNGSPAGTYGHLHTPVFHAAAGTFSLCGFSAIFLSTTATPTINYAGVTITAFG